MDGLVLEQNLLLDRNWKGQIKDKFGKHDVIKMEFNPASQQLKFYKNDELTNVVFNLVEMSNKYHFMVRIGGSGTVELIDFDMKNYDSVLFHDDAVKF